MEREPTTRSYIPRHASWPYTPTDFTRYDPSPDPSFYTIPRFVTHIDDNAISVLTSYYSTVLPKKGRILDFCSSWISHFPPELDQAAKRGDLEVIGMGMNRQELEDNSLLCERIIQDLNIDPAIPSSMGALEAATCVVSIDYLIKPLEVLKSIKERLKPGGMVHLVISNRCFPTKVVKRWLEISEEQRLDMVGDYLHFAGYDRIEIVTLSDGRAIFGEEGEDGRIIDGHSAHVDPLWVVRGSKSTEGEFCTRLGLEPL